MTTGGTRDAGALPLTSRRRVGPSQVNPRGGLQPRVSCLGRPVDHHKQDEPQQGLDAALRAERHPGAKSLRLSLCALAHRRPGLPHVHGRSHRMKNSKTPWRIVPDSGVSAPAGLSPASPMDLICRRLPSASDSVAAGGGPRGHRPLAQWFRHGRGAAASEPRYSVTLPNHHLPSSTTTEWTICSSPNAGATPARTPRT
jgi:hypothetical protein